MVISFTFSALLSWYFLSFALYVFIQYFVLEIDGNAMCSSLFAFILFLFRFFLSFLLLLVCEGVCLFYFFLLFSFTWCPEHIDPFGNRSRYGLWIGHDVLGPHRDSDGMNGVLNALALHGVQNEVGGIGGIGGNTFGGIGATPRDICAHIALYVVMMWHGRWICTIGKLQ